MENRAFRLDMETTANMSTPEKDVVGVSSISVDTCNFEEQSEVKVVSPPAFSTVSLDEAQGVKKTRVPRRILHFSDGTLEEFSTDEEDETDSGPKQPPVDPKTLTWMPWVWYYIVASASGVLGVADLCGEKLAWALGITSPKYQYAIDEYQRLQKEEEEEKERENREQLAEQKRLAEQMQHMEGAIELDTFNSVNEQPASVTVAAEDKPNSDLSSTLDLGKQQDPRKY